MDRDQEPTIARRLAVPILASMVLISIVTGFVCWQVASAEFHHFEQVIQKEKSEFPSFCVDYQHATVLNLLIPLGIAVWAGRLVGEAHCSVRQLIWFVCASVVAVFLWSVASFLAVYLLHLKFYRYM